MTKPYRQSCKCHPERRHYVKGLCEACYSKVKRARKTKMASCHPNRKEKAHDLCDSCYLDWREKNNPIKSNCHPEKGVCAKGLCKTCYHKQRKQLTKKPPKPRVVRTLECHPDRKYYSKGLCESCYVAKKKPEYYAKNRERILEVNKKWREKNAVWFKAIQKECSAKWRAENYESYNASRRTPEYRALANAYESERMKTDLDFNIRTKLRRRLRLAILAYGDGTKACRSMKLLGCTMKQFKEHLSALFTGDMSWEWILDGELEIDHKIPCSAFDLTNPEQQKLCFHFSNLQPMWHDDNLKKGNRMTEEQVLELNEMINSIDTELTPCDTVETEQDSILELTEA